MPENLKLPICPRCNETKTVKSHNSYSTKMSPRDYNYYSCSACKIDWNYWAGIHEKQDTQSDSSIHIFYEPKPARKVEWYGWCTYGIGILDSRRIIDDGKAK
jgi:hypothetical protein